MDQSVTGADEPPRDLPAATLEEVDAKSDFTKVCMVACCARLVLEVLVPTDEGVVAKGPDPVRELLLLHLLDVADARTPPAVSSHLTWIEVVDVVPATGGNRILAGSSSGSLKLPWDDFEKLSGPALGGSEVPSDSKSIGFEAS